MTQQGRFWIVSCNHAHIHLDIDNVLVNVQRGYKRKKQACKPWSYATSKLCPHIEWMTGLAKNEWLITGKNQSSWVKWMTQQGIGGVPRPWPFAGCSDLGVAGPHLEEEEEEVGGHRSTTALLLIWSLPIYTCQPKFQFYASQIHICPNAFTGILQRNKFSSSFWNNISTSTCVAIDRSTAAVLSDSGHSTLPTGEVGQKY